MIKKLLAFFILAASAGNYVNAQNKIVLDASNAKDTINKNIYGHFAEHLGRQMYLRWFLCRRK